MAKHCAYNLDIRRCWLRKCFLFCSTWASELLYTCECLNTSLINQVFEESTECLWGTCFWKDLQCHSSRNKSSYVSAVLLIDWRIRKVFHSMVPHCAGMQVCIMLLWGSLSRLQLIHTSVDACIRHASEMPLSLSLEKELSSNNTLFIKILIIFISDTLIFSSDIFISFLNNTIVKKKKCHRKLTNGKIKLKTKLDSKIILWQAILQLPRTVLFLITFM